MTQREKVLVRAERDRLESANTMLLKNASANEHTIGQLKRERDRLQADKKYWHETAQRFGVEFHREKQEVRKLLREVAGLCDWLTIRTAGELLCQLCDHPVSKKTDGCRACELRAHLSAEASKPQPDSSNWQCTYEWINCAKELVRCSQPAGHDWEHTSRPPLGPIPMALRKPHDSGPLPGEE